MQISNPRPTHFHASYRNYVLDNLGLVALYVTQARERNTLPGMKSNSDGFDVDIDSDQDNSDILEPIIIPSPSSIPPLILLNIFDSGSELDDQDSDDMDDQDQPYQCLLGEIAALIDEVERVQFLNRLNVPLLWAPQLHLLKHFAVFQPHLFHKKLHVDPVIFDCIVDKIHEHEIFHSG